MKPLCYLLLLALTFGTLYSEDVVQPEYYWRNYNGDIPDDAFEAGVDSSGRSIYIGQGLFLNDGVGLLPGTVHAGSSRITVTARLKVYSTDKFVKILCTRYPQYFHWVKVNSYADISPLTNVHLVEGGVETNSVVHVGRAFHEGNTEIGKIYKLSPTRVMVSFPNEHGRESSYQNFEILTYNLTLLDVRCCNEHALSN